MNRKKSIYMRSWQNCTASTYSTNNASRSGWKTLRTVPFAERTSKTMRTTTSGKTRRKSWRLSNPRDRTFLDRLSLTKTLCKVWFTAISLNNRNQIMMRISTTSITMRTITMMAVYTMSMTCPITNIGEDKWFDWNLLFSKANKLIFSI